MYEYSKTILDKVSYDRKLFAKELNKAIQWVKPEEKPLLRQWVFNKYSDIYEEDIRDAFSEQQVLRFEQ